MGAPAELYDNPQTTFVANFLGQSNLIEGDGPSAASGDFVTVDMQGTLVSIPADRAHVSGTDGELGWVGIRPEKVLIGRGGRGRSTRPATASPAASSPTSASSASARSTSCGCRGARSSRSSSRTPARRRLFRQGDAGRPLLATRVRLPARPQPGRHAGVEPEDDGRDARPPPRRRSASMTRPAEEHRAAQADRLPAAAARRALAGRVLRRPALLAGRHQPLRPRRLRARAATT